jgi:hypothetical protein
MTRRHGILAAVLAAFFLLAGAAPTQALDRDDKCERRVQKAEANLQRAIRRHGEHSRQAEQKRRQLEETRERCHHDHDRDHDRDHDHH